MGLPQLSAVWYHLVTGGHMWSQGSHGFILTKFGHTLPFLATHRSLQIYQHLVTGGHIWSHMVTMVIWVWYHLATGGHMWSHMVTMVTLVHIGQIWLRYVTFLPPIGNCRFGITWSQVVTYGHTGHLGMVSPGNSW